MPIVFRYPEDKTGVNPNNLVVDENHVLSNRPVRAIVPNYGPIFTEGVVVVDTATNLPLTKGTDYVFAGILEEPTMRLGKEVCELILVKNQAVSPTVKIQYQVLGGLYQNDATYLEQLYDAFMSDNRPVDWADIVNKLPEYPPSFHLHMLSDMYGFEKINFMLERVIQAITLRNIPAFEQLIDYVHSRFNNYQYDWTTALSSEADARAQDDQALQNAIDSFTNIALYGPTTVKPQTNYSWIITDFDSFANYSVSASVGNVSLSGDTINYYLPPDGVYDSSFVLTVTKNDHARQVVIAIDKTRTSLSINPNIGISDPLNNTGFDATVRQHSLNWLNDDTLVPLSNTFDNGTTGAYSPTWPMDDIWIGVSSTLDIFPNAGSSYNNTEWYVFDSNNNLVLGPLVRTNHFTSVKDIFNNYPDIKNTGTFTICAKESYNVKRLGTASEYDIAWSDMTPIGSVNCLTLNVTVIDNTAITELVLDTPGTYTFTAPYGIVGQAEYISIGAGGGGGGGSAIPDGNSNYQAGGGGGGGGSGDVKTGSLSLQGGYTYTIYVGEGGIGGIGLATRIYSNAGDGGSGGSTMFSGSIATLADGGGGGKGSFSKYHISTPVSPYGDGGAAGGLNGFSGGKGNVYLSGPDGGVRARTAEDGVGNNFGTAGEDALTGAVLVGGGGAGVLPSVATLGGSGGNGGSSKSPTVPTAGNIGGGGGGGAADTWYGPGNDGGRGGHGYFRLNWSFS